MAKLNPLTETEIQNIVSRAVTDAVDFIESEIAPERTLNQQYYNGETAIGHEEGRSKVVSTKCRDAVNQIKPSLLRVFLSTNSPVEFHPQNPEDVANSQQCTEYVNAKFRQCGGMKILDAAITDALIKSLGIIKVYYSNATKTQIYTYNNLDSPSFDFISSQDDVTVLEHSKTATVEIDQESGWLYLCDTGNQRVLRLNILSGEVGESLTTYGENLAGYYSMINAEFEVVASDSLLQPTGLDIYNERLLVSDYSTGDIAIYNIENNNVDRLGKIQTGLENDIMGIKVDANGSIWIVCKNSHELYQLTTGLMGDVNSDLDINMVDSELLSLHIIGHYDIQNEEYLSADLNFDYLVNIFDLLILIDLVNNTI